MKENELATIIVDAAFKIHTALGPGLLESIYKSLMIYELKKRGLNVADEVWIPIVYGDCCIEKAFRIDLLVEDKVIIELKSVEEIHPVHNKQVLTYLKLTGKKLGFLINFNEVLIRDGITRIANGLTEGPTL